MRSYRSKVSNNTKKTLRSTISSNTYVVTRGPSDPGSSFSNNTDVIPSEYKDPRSLVIPV